MADSLEALEQEAEARRKRGGGRNAGASRNPRKPPTGDDEVARRQEDLRRREEERERRRRQAEEPQAQEPDREPSPVPQGDPSKDQPEPAPAAAKVATKGKRARPTSMPFYPNPEHETFLWTITEAAAARQLRIPATAVLRLALTRLQEQMTPGEIVRALGNSVQSEGKMGRPRL